MRTLQILMSVASAALLTATPCIGQQVASPEKSSADLRSADWGTRASAFDALQKLPGVWRSPAMARQLAELLGRELSLIDATLRSSGMRTGVAEKYGEGYAEYEAEVLDTCVKYCERQTLLSVMLAEARSDLSAVRQNAVEVLGEIADKGFSESQQAMIDSTLLSNAKDTHSWFIRLGAVTAIASRLRQAAGMTNARREQLHSMIVVAAADKTVQVRISAVRSLGEIGDSRDLPLLQRIAASDPESSSVRGRMTYPVRDQAAHAIARMARPN